MGNKGRGTAPRPKNQPKKILISGEADVLTGIGGSRGGKILITTIDIQLIQLDLGVAAQVKIGDFVQLHWRDSKYEVNFDGQRLGNVPGNFNRTLLPKSDYKGRLIKVAIYGNPIVVIVQLHLSTE